jgi:hypothetical protein
VKRLSEAAEPTAKAVSTPPTMIENQLTRSIEQVKAQRALQAPAGLQNTQTTGTHNTPNSTPPIAHTVISKIMASALIAAFDATQEAERYAHSKGVEIEFGADDIRAISNTIFIAISKDPAYTAQRQTVNGGVRPWQQ